LGIFEPKDVRPAISLTNNKVGRALDWLHRVAW
jgi:hypothetical protein